jgi:hypothetical protein
MDTEYDFLLPEFLNILFFQQKNVVIFPYVDLKHLKTLEVFTAGHNVIDLESTALYNLEEIIYEANNSYSQGQTFFFIYGLDAEKLSDILSLNDIRCVLNINQNVSELANGSNFIFYNKKNKQFLNYNESNGSLEFEKHLISTSSNKAILQDKIQGIKNAATKIYYALNEDMELNLPSLFGQYNPKFWNKILRFAEQFFKIQIPEHYFKEEFNVKSSITIDKINPSDELKDFSHEYELIIKKNNFIAQEFIQVLHSYRSKKVNSSNLDLSELYNPQKLYNYLRNHHWKDGFPVEFIQEWVRMNHTNYSLKDTDIDDFESIFKKFNIDNGILLDILAAKEDLNQYPEESLSISHNPTKNEIPTTDDFSEFRKWLLNKLKDVEELIANNRKN